MFGIKVGPRIRQRLMETFDIDIRCLIVSLKIQLHNGKHIVKQYYVFEKVLKESNEQIKRDK